MILISAGHGGTDKGAVSNQYVEGSLATNLRDIVAYYLQESGVPFMVDGERNKNLPLKEAIKLAKMADIAVEIHFNAATNRTAKGVEVLCQPKDKVLAQAICKAISDVTGSPLRGDKGYKPENSGQHSRLGFVQAGGLIVEVEFITNNEMMAIYEQRRWQVAKSIAQVLIDAVK